MNAPADASAQQKEAFKFAQDLIKQVITLATGVLTLTLTFLEKVGGATATQNAGPRLTFAWVLLIGSILSGLVGLMGLTGALSSGGMTINTGYLKFPVILQVLAFVAGVSILTWAVADP